MGYVVYYPDEGRYSTEMSYNDARRLAKQFPWACVVNLKTAEVIS